MSKELRGMVGSPSLSSTKYDQYTPDCAVICTTCLWSKSNSDDETVQNLLV